ncbi:MAG: helix-turn-helix domain-containing protein [Defluviitaleaceae bacterium]|nr:helix-turn-helix domain-containing protein [Defluviitaleaceae bacterium]
MVATVLLIENGKYNPSLILAYSIAKVFNVAIEDIFEIIDEEERV